MQSHDDRDFQDNEILKKLFGERLVTKPEDVERPFMEQLEAEAVRMSDEGRNRITAGDIGEEVLLEQQVGRVSVRQLPDDPLGLLRISIGGGEKIDGYYLVFRGDRDKIREALRHAMRALDRLDRA